MSAVALGNNYYNEYHGVDYLSKTFQSSILFAPSDVTRRTISQEIYSRHRAKESRAPKTPWGRKYSYGGSRPLCLPEDHRPKSEPPIRVQKTHLHISAGSCIHPRYVTTSQQYTRTSLKKSDVRSNDELIESPPKVDITKHVINLKFPAEHPYTSHTERASLFPPYDLPANQHAPSPADVPATAPDVHIISKARGSAYRYERTAFPADRERKPLQWHEGPNFFQLPKGANKENQNYYPTPVKLLDPNYNFPRDISSGTESALPQMRHAQWMSTYKNDMNGKQQAFVPQESTSNGGTKLSSDGGNVLKSEGDEFPLGGGDHKEISTVGVELIDGAENAVSAIDVKGTINKSVHFADHDMIQNRSNEKLAENDQESVNNITAISPVRELSSASGRNMAEKYPKPVLSATYPPTKSHPTYKPLREITNLSTTDVTDRQYSEELIRGWSRNDVRRRFNLSHNDDIPDLRRKPDLRITTNERRHRFPGSGDVASYVWNGLSLPYFKGTMDDGNTVTAAPP